MKKTILSTLFAVVLIGCAALTTQTVSYKTLSSVETTTLAAFDGYLTSVAKGKVSTNALPKIANDFKLFQDGMKAATVLVQGNTNAVAPAELSAASAALLSEISQAK